MLACEAGAPSRVPQREGSRAFETMFAWWGGKAEARCLRPEDSAGDLLLPLLRAPRFLPPYPPKLGLARLPRPHLHHYRFETAFWYSFVNLMAGK
jgi:hypothetical protein